MWQEIVVGLVVAACALYVGWRIWNIFRIAQKEDVACSCDCSQCGQKDDAQACFDHMMNKQ